MNIAMTSINTKILLCLTAVLSVVSCTHPEAAQDKSLSKLERLHHVRPDSVMDYYDLSGDSLKEFPDLSRYVIRSLDLSHNQLDTFVPRYLPTGLEKLNLSYNRLEGKLEIHKLDVPMLEELDVSHNSLLEFFCRKPLRRLILAHNMLDYNVWVSVSQYLDVSYNTYFCPHLLFDSASIDTIVSEGLADKEPLRCLVCFPGVTDRKRLSASNQLSETAMTYIKYYMDSPDSLRKAIRLLDASLRAKNYFFGRDIKAMCLAHLGKREAALEIMEQIEATIIIERKKATYPWLPHELPQLLSKGIALELNGRKKEAQEAYRKAYDNLKRELNRDIELATSGKLYWSALCAECKAALFLMDNQIYPTKETLKKVFGPQAVWSGTIDDMAFDLFNGTYYDYDSYSLKRNREDRLLMLWRNRILMHAKYP